MAAPDARQPRRPRPTAGHGRQAPHGAPRRHPLPGPALPRPCPGRLHQGTSDHPLRPARHHRDPGIPPQPVLCRAISPEHAGETITLKDIQAARAAHRRALRGQINERITRITDFLPGPAPDQAPQLPSPVPRRATPRLRTYLEDTRWPPAPPKPRAAAFIATKEHRRFQEFACAVRRHRYIGLCYDAAGVGKTLSARRYARWDLAEPLLLTWGPREDSDAKAYAALASARTVFYTPTVGGTLRELREELKLLTSRADICIDEHLRTRRPGSSARPGPHRSSRPGHIELLIIDEAERLSATALEYLRDQFDRTGTGLVLIGMPGIEKRMARYPQLYSRVGFAHHYRPLQGDELSFVLTRHWRHLGLALDNADFTDSQAIAAIARITGGNFRLLHRLFVQIERILRINDLTVITSDVVEAARSTLVIGDAT
jgi:DNA transposition AAA+ family ATPase